MSDAEPTEQSGGADGAKRNRWRIVLPLVAVAGVFFLVTSYAVARARVAVGHPLRVIHDDGTWIRAAGVKSHAGYFRKRFDLPGHVRHAWLRIAATDAFEVSVNRNPLGRFYLWRPTRPFQNGSSEKGQVLLPQEPAMALNFPREHQWDGHDSWRLPTYLQLTSLRPGKNVITVEIESRSAPARVHFQGEIHLWNGQVIPIQSDESWRGEPSIPGPQRADWTEPEYVDHLWRTAMTVDPPDVVPRRSHPEEIYQKPFAGKWMRHPEAAGGEAVTFRTDWNLNGPVDEAWIRLITNRRYELWINGTRVRVASIKPPDLDNGDWTFGRGSSFDPTTKPELLDPDEVGSNFVGKRFESPRNAAPGLEEFKRPFSPNLTPFRYERTYNRAQAPGVWEPKRTLAESRRTPETPDLYPERPRPNSLKHNHSSGGMLSYSVGNLLHQGDNRVEIRCLDQPGANWTPQIAIDGGARLLNENLVSLGEQRWRTISASLSTERDVRVIGPAHQSGRELPRMQYRGVALSPQSFETFLRRTLKEVGICLFVFLGITLGCASLLDRFRPESDGPGADNRLVVSTAQTVYVMLLTATIAIGAGLLLECSWTERHEMLWFYDGSMWAVTFLVAAAAAMLTGVLDTVGRFGFHRLRRSGHGITGALRDLPQSRNWWHLIVWVLLLTALLRAYKLDLQPLDDDEYASTQAVMAILETWTPRFVPDDVFYTRSPLFHYLTAAVAWPFGGDLWSLRLQTVAWSVATAWLAYLCGSRLLGSRWVGMISMLLIAIHPFEIFTGHVIRFYQIQQFFALLTMYCFCRGFVTDQSQRFRIATMFIFLLAIVSQEITVAMGPSLLFCYIVFAKDFGWTKNIQLGLFCVVVVGLIGLDFVVFQTLCLTRTEGVSPSIEASVKPHFWYPMNLLSIFIGYSRLHVVPSCFFFLGLPLLWRERNRNTLALLAFLVSGVVMTNVLVTNVSLRYLYWLFPVWILLSVNGMRLLLSTIVAIVHPPEQRLNRYVATVGVCLMVCCGAVVASWSPWRIPGSYELRILGDSTGAVRWVRSQKRPGDRIAITEPHTHCAYMEGEKCDYDIAIPLLYDFAVMRDGVLVDRNGGGEVVSNLDQLIGVFSKGERVWVLLNREKFRTRGKNMRWEYPGARFEKFIRSNCELKYRTYLWSVFLWDPARGHYDPFQLQE